MLASMTKDIKTTLEKINPEASEWEILHRFYDFLLLYSETKQFS